MSYVIRGSPTPTQNSIRRYIIKVYIQVKEVEGIIHTNFKNRTAPGFYILTETVLKKIPDCAVRLITYKYNDILRLKYH